MSALGSKLRSIEGGKVGYWCPGCDMMHVLTVEPGLPGPCWDWDRDPDAPTFSPSILVRYEYWHPPVTGENLEDWKRKPWHQEKRVHLCHAFVRQGAIQFLTDSTHKLSGQTVEMPDFGVMQ